MGEDVHFRAYVRSKKTGKYINAHEICEWDPKYSIFEELAGDRNYNLFSLFGSRRGEYRELSHANYGMPDFLKDTEFEEYCRECGYYGFIWFGLEDMKKALDEYRTRLENPYKYLAEDDFEEQLSEWNDARNLLVLDSGIEKFMMKYKDWLESHRNILDRISEMQKKVSRISEEAGDENSPYGKTVDLNDTVFLFFFDS